MEIDAARNAFELHIPVRKPWIVRPGQYVYITEPSRPSRFIGIFQSHPYMIAWSEQDNNDGWAVQAKEDNWKEESSTSISLLIQRRRGFSRMPTDTELQGHNSLRITLDGPYGRGPPLHLYDKVMFIASGIGIAAHLNTIRQLLKGHTSQTAQVRRLCLLWHVDNIGKLQYP